MLSKFDEYTKEQLEEIIESCNSIREVIKKVGLCGNGAGSYETFNRKIKKLNLDISNLKERAKIKQKKSFFNKKSIPLEQVLVENSNYSRKDIKKRLLKENILENKCSICGQLPIWNNKPLVLELDHINGVNNDNRIENLRIVCGHCHSQLPTTGSRRLKKNKQPKVKNINEKENINIEIVRKSNIDFTKFGWVQKVANLIGKHPQKINKWMKKYLPEILEKSFRKHTL